MTKDLDIFVRASTENAQKIVQALHAFGAPKSLTQKSDFETPGMVIQLGVPPWQIDLLTEISGVDFEQAARHHTTFRFVNTLAPVIGKKELIRNKLATGRPQDILDISVLKRLSTRATPSKPKSTKRRKVRK